MARAKTLPLPQELIEMFDQLRRLGSEPLVLSTDRLNRMPMALRDALTGTKMLERVGSSASSVTCPGCAESCAMPVHHWPHHNGAFVAFVSCDKRSDMGRIWLAPQMLELWQVSLVTVARSLAQMLGGLPPIPLGTGFRLGWIDGAAGRFDAQLFADQSGPHIMLAGHRLELPQVLGWTGANLALDMAALKLRADVTGDRVGEKPADRRVRLMKLKAELLGAGNRHFLQTMAREEGCSVSNIKRLLRSGNTTGKSPLVARPKKPAGPFAGLG
jgi:hypothetical protein